MDALGKFTIVQNNRVYHSMSPQGIQLYLFYLSFVVLIMSECDNHEFDCVASTYTVIFYSEIPIPDRKLYHSLLHLMVVLVMCFYRNGMLSKTSGHLVMNEEVKNSIRHAIGLYEDLITTVRRQKIEMVWAHNKINRTCKEDPTRPCARREREKADGKKRWKDNISEWTGLGLG